MKPIIKKRFKKNVTLVALKPNKGMEHIEKLFAEGKINTVVDGPYPLEEAAVALTRFKDGLHTGKVILEIGV